MPSTRTVTPLCLGQFRGSGKSQYSTGTGTVQSLNQFHTHTQMRTQYEGLVSSEEFWAQILVGCGGLAAHSRPGSMKKKNNLRWHTQTHTQRREGARGKALKEKDKIKKVEDGMRKSRKGRRLRKTSS